MKLLHIKTICNWSDKSFDMVIDLIKKALPDGESLPRSYYEAKRFRKDLGFSYELIHACENDCVLYVSAIMLIFFIFFWVKICHNIILELGAHLEAKNTSCQLDRDQWKEHTDNLVVALSKVTDALVKIANKL